MTLGHQTHTINIRAAGGQSGGEAAGRKEGGGVGRAPSRPTHCERVGWVVGRPVVVPPALRPQGKGRCHVPSAAPLSEGTDGACPERDTEAGSPLGSGVGRIGGGHARGTEDSRRALETSARQPRLGVTQRAGEVWGASPSQTT